MARLYEMPQDEFQPELTGSLARSFKDGLILPAERKFNRMESELSALKEQTSADSQRLEQRLNEIFNRLDMEMAGLKKLLYISAALAILSLAGIVTTLAVLFTWY